MVNNRSLLSEMESAGFSKSEIAGSNGLRVFWSNLDPLNFQLEHNDELIDCSVPRSIVVEVAHSRHRDVYLFTPTLMLNGSPLSEDLRVTTKKLMTHEFIEWLQYLETLFIIEASRRGYGREFNTGTDRQGEVPGEYLFGDAGDSQPTR